MNVHGFILVAVIGTLLVGSAPAQENPVKPAGTVQLDLSKLPPELAKRVLAEIAAGKAAAGPKKADPANDRNLAALDKGKANAGPNREGADKEKNPAKPIKRKRGEKEKEVEDDDDDDDKKPGQPAKGKGPEKKERDD